MASPKLVNLTFLLAYSLFFSTIIHAATGEREEMPAIVWQVNPQCGTETDIIRGTLEILNSTTTSPFDFTTQKISGEISEDGAKWRVHLVYVDNAVVYERTLKANTCRGAIEAAILLSALAVDLKKVLQSEDPKLHARVDRLGQLPAANDSQVKQRTPQLPAAAAAEQNTALDNATTTEEKATTAVEKIPVATRDNVPAKDTQQVNSLPATAKTVAQPDSANTSSRPSRVQGQGMLGLGATMDMGLLSPIRPGVALKGTWIRRFWMLTTSVHYLPPVSTAVANGAMETRWTSQAFLSTLQAGHHFAIGRWGLGWALGMRLIGIRAKTEHIVTPDSKGVWTGAGVMGGHLTWLISRRMGLWLAPSAILLLTRPTFLVKGIGMIHQPKRMVAEVVIGLFYTFGNRKTPSRPFTQ